MKNLKILSKSILILVLISSISSCNILKKTSKTKYREQTDTILKVDSTSLVTNTVTTKETVDSTDIETVITEETTKKTTKRGDLYLKTPLLKINRYGETVLLDSLGRRVILLLDSLNLTLRFESPEVIEETTKKTTEIKDKTKKTTKDSTNTELKQVAIIKQEEYHKDTTESKKEAKMEPLVVISMFIGIALLVIIVIYGLKKFIFKI